MQNNENYSDNLIALPHCDRIQWVAVGHTHMHTYNFWFPIQVVDVPEMNLFSQSQEWHLQQHILLDMFESKGIWQPPGA
jgi:hypothetical protein